MKIRIAFFVVATFLFGGSALQGQSHEILDAWKSTEARQFDFWIGKWDVNLRMIQKDLTWKDSVKAKVEIYPILDGKAILELWDSKPIKGFSLRYFDPGEKKWILYLNWPNRYNSSIGSLKGEFRHGRGEFFSKSNRVISRYSFCDITPTSLRWDDAFSNDGGKTWRNNWIMEFTRTGKKPVLPIGDHAHTYAPGTRCPSKQTKVLESLGGQWKGKLTVYNGEKKQQVDAKLQIYKVLGGCSVIRFLEFELGGKTHREFGLLTYNPAGSRYEEMRMDNQTGTGVDVLRGKIKDGIVSLKTSVKKDQKALQKQHQWTLPTKDKDTIELTVSSSSGSADWKQQVAGTFARVKSKTSAKATDKKLAINAVCPRSGKPVVENSLTKYRGQTVGFCNQHCRDDFAANVADRPNDRKFFDKIIDRKKK